MEDYPSNSQRARHSSERPVEEPAQPDKKIEKVVQGDVVRRKKPMGRRVKELLIGGDDARSVWSYVAVDVLVPAAKDAIADAVSQGIERMLFGEALSRNRRPRTTSAANTGHINYRGMSSSAPQRPANWRPATDPRNRDPRTRAHEFDEIVIPNRIQAENVLDRMLDLISQYGQVTVADMLELCGLSGNFTDNKWGWTQLPGVAATRVRDGYILDLPRPEQLER